MAAKYHEIKQLAEDAALRATKSAADWMDYLDTAARLYRYPFTDQLLIHAQRPDASACAELETWNQKMFCWVNKGAKGIALLDESSGRKRLRYVFDVSDVHESRYIGRKPKTWHMREAYKGAALARLQKVYGTLDGTKSFGEQLVELADRLAEQSSAGIMSEFSDMPFGSILEGYGEDELGRHVRETVRDSVAYMLLSRCGIRKEERRELFSFPHIREFNLLETLSLMGNLVSELSGQALMEIGRAVFQAERENTLANGAQKDYNALKRESNGRETAKNNEHGTSHTGHGDRERSGDNGTDIYPERGLFDTKLETERRAGGSADEIRDTPEGLFKGASEGDIQRDAAEGDAEGALPDHPAPGPGASGAAHGADGAGPGHRLEAEGQGPVGMGAADEQHSGGSGRNGAGGAGLPLEEEPAGFYEQMNMFDLFPTVVEQAGTVMAAGAQKETGVPAVLSSAELMDIIRTGGNRENSRKRIYAKYASGKTPEEMTEFLKNEIGTTGKGFDFGGKKISVWFDERGMRIARGESADVPYASTYTWEMVEELTRSLIENGDYLSRTEAFLADSVERERVSVHIYYFFRDGMDGFPQETERKGNGSPYSPEKIAGMLASAQGRAELTEWLTEAKEKLENGSASLHWRYVVKRPDYLLGEVADIDAPRTAYPCPESIPVREESFITQDEIDAVLCGGSLFQEGKFRITEHFSRAHEQKEDIRFLKQEYGTGGHSAPFPGRDSGMEEHDAKGLQMWKGDFSDRKLRLSMNWKKVSERLRFLISHGRYLTGKEKEAYAAHKQEKALKAMEQAKERLMPESGREPESTIHGIVDDEEGRQPEAGRPTESTTPQESVTTESSPSQKSVKPEAVQPGSTQTEEDWLGRAKALIDNYMGSEFGTDADFSSPNNVPLAYTEITDDKIGADYDIQAAADLVKFEIKTYIDGKLYIRNNYRSLEELCRQELEYLDFADLIYVPESIWERVRTGQPLEETGSKEKEEERTPDASNDGQPSGTVPETEPDAHSEWRVTANPVGGEMLYSVYRIKDTSRVDYSGNRENACPYTGDRKAMEELAAELNGNHVTDLEQAQAYAEQFLSEREKYAPVFQNGISLHDFKEAVSNHRSIFIEEASEKSKEPVIRNAREERFLDMSLEYDSDRERYVLYGTSFKSMESGPLFLRSFAPDDVGGMLDYLKDAALSVTSISEESPAETLEQAENRDSLEDKTDEEAAHGNKEKAAYEHKDQAAHGHKPEAAASNFHITSDTLSAGTPKEKFQRNLAAIRTLKQIESEARPATLDEQEILAQYVGWGGLADAFDGTKGGWHKEYQQLKEILSLEEYESAKESTLNSHYTSPIVIRGIYQTLGRMGFIKGNILEPSMGIGNFFGMLPEQMAESRLYGVELDDITGRIAKQLYPQADIRIQGFEETDYPGDFFDVSVGNVPFGNYKVGDRQYDRLNFQVHDYFIAKTLDKVRSGGIAILITSKGTMDKKNPSARKYFAQRAELLGAVRLPNTAFREHAGAEVTADVLFFKKRDRLADIEPDWVHLGLDGNGITMNSYFVSHPEMIAGHMEMVSGPYGMESTCMPDKSAPLEGQLDAIFRKVGGSIDAAEIEELPEGIPEETVLADPDVKNFSYTLVDGKLYYRENSIMRRVSLPEATMGRIRGMLELRSCMQELLRIQMEECTDEKLHSGQAELGRLYDGFVGKYGRLYTQANRRAFGQDNSYFLLCSLEKTDEEGNFTGKADIFTKRTIRRAQPVTSVGTASEALAVSLSEKAGVDMEYMAALSGKTEDVIAEELSGVIYFNPLKNRWETADEYLSGNIRMKLAYTKALAAEHPEYAANVTALEQAMPKPLDATEIEVRLGVTWIGTDYIEDFMRDVLKTPERLLEKGILSVHYSDTADIWGITGKNADTGNSLVTMTYGTGRANAYRLLEESLNLKDIRIYDMVDVPDGPQKRVLNKKETALASQKQEAIREAFRDWLWLSSVEL